MILRGLLVFTLLSAALRSATYPATSWSEVQAACDSANQPGDVVFLDFASSNATSSVTWTAPVGASLIGRGSTSTHGGGDQTVVIDNSAETGYGFFAITVASTGVFRMSGITFQSGTGATKGYATIGLIGPGTVRIDHCRFNMTSTANYKVIVFNSGLRGVMDNCILDLQDLNALYFYNGRGAVEADYEWSQPTAFGTDDFFYIEDCVINGSLPSSGRGLSTRLLDGFNGAKVVVRFNDLYRAVITEAHVTGQLGDSRGMRAQEVYGNLVTTAYNPVDYDPNNGMAQVGSGVGLIWGNEADQVYKNMLIAGVLRAGSPGRLQSAPPDGWGYAGPTPAATVVVNITGTAMTRVSGDNFDTGWPANSYLIVKDAMVTKSVSSITRSGTTATVTCTSHGWSTGAVVAILGAEGADGNLYNGVHTVTVTDANTFTYTMAGTPTGSATGTLLARVGLQATTGAYPDMTGVISSVNSTSSITLDFGGYTAGTLSGVTCVIGSAWDGNQLAGGYPALDQPGRGQGDLLTGLFPNKVNDTTGTVAWPNQALEPIYTWSNAVTLVSGFGGSLYNTDANRVVANRDYYAQASGVQTNATTPFNGTSGVGWGTLANRPTTCTTGVAYWATDQGDWNQSMSNPYGVQQNGANGILYVATATDTWTLYYEPYTYPHPLREEIPSVPAKQRLKKVIQSGILMNRRRR